MLAPDQASPRQCRPALDSSPNETQAQALPRGTEHSVEHATASAHLSTVMNPEYLSASTLRLVPGTPIHRRAERRHFELPRVDALSRELRILVERLDDDRTRAGAQTEERHLAGCEQCSIPASRCV